MRIGGPDGHGEWVGGEGRVALAHRRLAVIDLSDSGRQPMLSHSGRYVIVFNGEIYNHGDLRQSLNLECGEPIPWRGTSDTESFLEYIEHHGLERSLQKAIGMFAFALWDKCERTLYLACDRLGEKPLYYGSQNEVFLFGSELKAMRCHPAFDGRVDRSALVTFLRYRYVPSPLSIYCGIRKLPAATYLAVGAAQTERSSGADSIPRPYWSIGDAIKIGQLHPFKGDEIDAVEAVHTVLSDAVRAQMISDVPLGAFLSRGIDSSTIVALMQAQSSRKVRTFSIGFEEEQYDEAAHAKAVADHLGTEHTELYVSSRDALDVIPRLPTVYDEPFADPSGIPTCLVAKMARSHVTVALSGDGGDELFGGYDRYRHTRAIRRALSVVPRPARRLLRGGAAFAPLRCSEHGLRRGGRRSWFETVEKLCYIVDFESSREVYYRLVSDWKKPAAVVIDGKEPMTVLTDSAAWPDVSELESWMMAMDGMTYLPDQILVKVDRAAMATGLETRAPFLDHRVAEFAWRLPTSMKIRSGQGKWVVRQVLDRYVPRQLVERPKMGFGVPIGRWLRAPLRDWAESLLDERRLVEDGFFAPQPIRERWTRHVSGLGAWDYELWSVLMFQDAIVSNSYAQRHRIGDIAPRLLDRTEVIVNGIDVEYFRPSAETSKRNVGKLRILVLARFAPQKNVLGFLDAVELVYSRHPEVGVEVDWYGRSRWWQGSLTGVGGALTESGWNGTSGVWRRACRGG